MNANINKIKMDNISHTSSIGSAIIFDKITLMITINGMANKKIIPNAIHFLVFPIRFQTAAITHRKRMEATDITTPIENTSFTFINLLNKNK